MTTHWEMASFLWYYNHDTCNYQRMCIIQWHYLSGWYITIVLCNGTKLQAHWCWFQGFSWGKAILISNTILASTKQYLWQTHLQVELQLKHLPNNLPIYKAFDMCKKQGNPYNSSITDGWLNITNGFTVPCWKCKKYAEPPRDCQYP